MSEGHQLARALRRVDQASAVWTVSAENLRRATAARDSAVANAQSEGATVRQLAAHGVAPVVGRAVDRGHGPVVNLAEALALARLAIERAYPHGGDADAVRALAAIAAATDTERGTA